MAAALEALLVEDNDLPGNIYIYFFKGDAYLCDQHSAQILQTASLCVKTSQVPMEVQHYTNIALC